MSATSRPRFIGAPPGASVTLRITWHGEGRPYADDIAESTGGSLYFVDEAHPINQQDWPPKRWRLECTKIDPDGWEGDPDWELTWNRRG